MLSLTLTLTLALTLTACAGPPMPLQAPVIVPVQSWGGTPGQAPEAPQRIQRISLHHQGETWVAGSDVAAYLRRLQQWSRLSRRWADIPYHYVIAPDGQIYAARDERRAGDTNTEYDPQGHALVMLLGNFEIVEPPPEQLRAAVELTAWLVRQHGLSLDTIASHKDYSRQTVCPGKHLYAYLESGWFKRAVAARLAGQPMPAR